MRHPLSLTVAFLFIFFTTYAQETCTTEEIVDANSITKCTIKDVEETLNKLEEKQIRTRTKRKKVAKSSSLTSKKIKNLDAPLETNEDYEDAEETINQVKEATDKLAPLKKIPFYLVDQIPLFDKCENTPLLKQTECFEKQMARHITNNFTYPKEALSKKIEGKILIQFTINKEGNVIDIKKKGPENTEILEEEAEKLISRLPKFIPGTHNGEKVLVKYALPIIFKLPKNI